MKRVSTVQRKNIRTHIRKRRYPPPRDITTVIHADGVIELPPGLVSWTMGTRVYWRIRADLSVQGSTNPKGCILNGRYQSARVRKRVYINKPGKTEPAPQ